ncbi:hypothetical protein VTI74DRAFT_1706 [Chaetomium olivicolor]
MVRLGAVSGLAGLALAASSAQAASSNYRLIDYFDVNNFFQEFDFYTGKDPTHGFVKYLDLATANSTGIAGTQNGAVYLGVDSTNKTDTGRNSVRVTSKKSYTKGLFIADIAHMPAAKPDSGACGLWPAFWMFGPDWPNSGEIDIIEGVNGATSNSVSLHTGLGCNITNFGAAAGTALSRSSCYSNEGCSQKTQATDNFGPGFNAGGGGVYALEWTDTVIQVWFFPRGSAMEMQLTSLPTNTIPSPYPTSTGTASYYKSVPNNNNNDNTTTTTPSVPAPDPSTFGTPMAIFSGCAFRNHFANHNLVFNTAFCGDWAGSPGVWNATCASVGPSCAAYVGANPTVFEDAYWLVNGIRVYQVAGQPRNGNATTAVVRGRSLVQGHGRVLPRRSFPSHGRVSGRRGGRGKW